MIYSNVASFRQGDFQFSGPICMFVHTVASSQGKSLMDTCVTSNLFAVTNPTLKSCAQGFTRFSPFKSHLDRKHKQQCTQDHSLDEGNDDPDHGIIDVPIEDDDQADEDDDDIDQDTDIEKITKFIALFVLKMKEVNVVSQQAIDSMLDNTKTLVDHCLQMLGGEVKL